jgi:fatty acid synthase
LSDEKLQASVRCLAHEGRFLEIGKSELSKNPALGMAVFLMNISFHGILLDSLFEGKSLAKKSVFLEMSNGIQSGIVKPLRRTVFNANEAEDAFR